MLDITNSIERNLINAGPLFACSVDIMSKKLDPENLGIILMNAFMDEFFPEEKRSTPDTFDLMHYNGIPGSNVDNKVIFIHFFLGMKQYFYSFFKFNFCFQVKYVCGSAILLESDLRSVSISNAMLTCLQTKWPNIEVNWHDGRTPSLN